MSGSLATAAGGHHDEVVGDELERLLVGVGVEQPEGLGDQLDVGLPPAQYRCRAGHVRRRGSVTCQPMSELPEDFQTAPLSEVDPEIARVLDRELERQQRTLEMIAS